MSNHLDDELNYRQRLIKASTDYMDGTITLDEYWAVKQEEGRRLREMIEGVARWRLTRRGRKHDLTPTPADDQEHDQP